MPRSQEPPFSGELTFVVEGPPVSQQSRRSEKDTFAKSIRAQMSECGYLISGDVRIYIEWTLHEQDRYESDAAPDVDNILKPLLDALCGPERSCCYFPMSTAAKNRSSDSTSLGSATVSAISWRKSSRYRLRSR